jgi:hypothetical protein
MFGWLKGIRNAAQGALVGPLAVRLWKMSFNEVATAGGGARCNDIDFWREVANGFIVMLNQHPQLRMTRADTTYDMRCEAYLSILEEILLGHSPPLSQSDLERIGEFIAFAVTRGPEEAIVVDPERASLIYDALPTEWMEGAGLPPDKFEALYFKATGKHRP